MSKNAVRNSRRTKVELGAEKPTPKKRFMEAVAEIETMEQSAVPKFVPASTRQKEALAMLREGRSVVFLTGSAGTGKSMLAAYHSATVLKTKKIDKVFLIRPAVATGKSIGLLPGTIEEKMAPYFAQTVAHLSTYLGEGFLRYCLEKKTIEMKPVEYMRGTSFESCIVIAEECQNFTEEEFEMLLTRIGKNCTLILTGDQKQHDMRGVSGLEKTLQLLEEVQSKQPEYLSDEDLDEMEKNIGIVVFKPEDVVRSGITRAFVKMYHNN